MIALALLLAAVLPPDLPEAPRPEAPRPEAPRPHLVAINAAVYERWKLSQMSSANGYRESTVILGASYALSRRVWLGASGAMVVNEGGTVTWNTSAGLNIRLIELGQRGKK